LGDTNIQYFGRWDFSNPSQYLSYWGGAYIRVKFSGTTAKIVLGNTSNFYFKIDNGAWTTVANATGTVNLTPTPLVNGTHTLSVAQGKDYDYLFNFRGLIFDPGATTGTPSVSANLIEFVGDSITAGYTDPQADVSDYAWVSSEALNCEHTQIAYPGVNLTSGYTGAGMDAQYFKEQSFNYPSSPAWDFSRYTAKAVVINLGTNDVNNRVPGTVFQNTYATFLAHVRTEYPNADIFAMRTFLGGMESETQASVMARNMAGDGRVHYVDTTGWLTGSDYNDGVHPSVSGHIKAANLLEPILSYYLSGGLASGTYKILNRNSGMALDATGQGTGNGTPIEQWTYNGGDNQLWNVTNIGNGQYKIVGVQSGKPLDVMGQSTTDGAAVQLYTDNGGGNQHWILNPTWDGYYTVQGVQSGKLLEVVGIATNPGALVDIWSDNGGSNQQWAFRLP